MSLAIDTKQLSLRRHFGNSLVNVTHRWMPVDESPNLVNNQETYTIQCSTLVSSDPAKATIIAVRYSSVSVYLDEFLKPDPGVSFAVLR